MRIELCIGSVIQLVVQALKVKNVLEASDRVLAPVAADVAADVQTRPIEAFRRIQLNDRFLGIDSLVNVFVDKIFQEEYFILQFKSLAIMRNLTHKFNKDSECPAIMTPQKYVK